MTRLDSKLRTVSRLRSTRRRNYRRILFPPKLEVSENGQDDREDYTHQESGSKIIELGKPGLFGAVRLGQISLAMLAPCSARGNRLFTERANGGLFGQRHAIPKLVYFTPAG